MLLRPAATQCITETVVPFADRTLKEAHTGAESVLNGQLSKRKSAVDGWGAQDGGQQLVYEFSVVEQQGADKPGGW